MDLNVKLPWTTESYLESERGDKAQTKHALLHLMKATGEVAAKIEPLDHNHEMLPLDYEGRLSKYLADIVICAVRIANLVGINLDEAVRLRIKAKMGKEA